MASDPRIALTYRNPEIIQPAGMMALRNVAQEANFRQATQRDVLSKRVKEEALSAYDQMPDAPEPERQRRYQTAWQQAVHDIERSGLFQAAGVSQEEVGAAKMNVVPPEVARAAAVSLSDIGKKEREQSEYLARMTKYGNESREITRREEKDAAERKKAESKAQTQQAGQLYFTAVQQAIASGASDEEADAVGRQALSQAGPQAASFDPDGMAVSDEGEFIKTGAMQVAKRAAPITPGDGAELSPLGPKMGTGEDYDWRKAYLYNASVNSKFNPQTAKTLVDYRTGRVIPNEPVIAASERVAKAGASSVSVGDFGKAAENKLDISTIDTSDALQRLGRMRQSFDPDYLTWTRQWSEIWSSFKERAGVDLTPKEKKKLENYTRFRRKTLNSLNLYIKLITGAQVGQAGETIRLSAAQPTMDDGPTKFKGKLDDVIEELEDVMSSVAQFKKGGPNAVLEPYTGDKKSSAPLAKPAGKEAWSAGDQKRLDELERKYGK